MKLCAVVVTSSTKEAIVGDAVRSCRDWVDGVVVVHIVGGSEEPDQTLGVIEQLHPRVFRRTIDIKTPFAQIRDAGLRFAYACGFDWAMQLDTDERMVLNGSDPRGFLQHCWSRGVDAVTVMNANGIDEKARFFKLPPTGGFVGDFHEDYEGFAGSKVRLERMRFTELPKSPEDRRAYYSRVLEGVRNQHLMDRSSFRWCYYLAACHEELGMLPAAAELYDRAEVLSSTKRLASWCRFRQASCLMRDGQPGSGLQCSVDGIARDPGCVELWWMASLCAYRTRALETAVRYATRAARLQTGTLLADSAVPDGFRDPVAYFEGPWEVLAQCAKELGNARDEAEAAGMIRKRRANRLLAFERGEWR